MKKFAVVMAICLLFSTAAFAGGHGSNNHNVNQNHNNNHNNNHNSLFNYSPDYSYRPQTNTNNNNVDVNNNVDINNRVNVDVNNRVNNRVNVDTTDININRNVIEEGAVQNHNIQGQMQGQKQDQNQGQRQAQGQNNNQTISPNQSIMIERPFANIPSTGTPELNFGHGYFFDITKSLPKFRGIEYLKEGDTIHTVLDVVANVHFKKLYKTLLTLANEYKTQNPYMRFQIMMAESQKSWTTGGSLIGGGTGVLGTTGTAGSGSLIPSIGRTKAHPLYTVVVVNVIPE